MNIYEKIQDCRVALQSQIKKSGKNKFAGFDYFELADFLPTLNKLMAEIKLFSAFNIFGDLAVLKLINTEKPEEILEFTANIVIAETKGTSAIQNLGATHTYMKRYLYLHAFEIAESDIVDAQPQKTEQTKTEQKKIDNKSIENKQLEQQYVDFVICPNCKNKAYKNVKAGIVVIDKDGNEKVNSYGYPIKHSDWQCSECDNDGYVQKDSTIKWYAKKGNKND